MADLETDLQPDARYEPFPAFGDWPRAALEPRAKLLARELELARGEDPEAFGKAVQFALRAAAFDTGALEALYSTDRGLTFSVAVQAAAWQQEVAARDEDALRFFEAQLEAYELILDAVTGKLPISEAWIRRLHEEICRSQETYTVRTPQGVQRHTLVKGRYKTQANHVVEADGTLFAFAPVAETPREMHRLISELQGNDFRAASPIDQAAYAHYAFVRIHPFADGNGRIARALASVFLYQDLSIPLLILADQREEYLEALKAADRGREQHFSAFIQDRVTEALDLVLDQLRAPQLPPAQETILRLSPSQSVQRSGSPVISAAAEGLLKLAYRTLTERLESLELPPPISGQIKLLSPKGGNPAEPTGGGFTSDQSRLLIRFSKQNPPELGVAVEDQLALRIADDSDSVSLVGIQWEESLLRIEASKVSEKPGTFASLKISAWADRLLRKALHELNVESQRLLDELSR